MTRASLRRRLDAQTLDHLQEVRDPGAVAALRSIPRQTYAVFRHHTRSPNLHAELQPTLHFIWGTWLATSAYEYAGGPDFERYPPDFEGGKPGTYLDIAVPVRKRAA